jgi:hypothetical protein
MSSKSAVKLVAPADTPDALFRWVTILTGSKNALKGVGFFLGGLLLTIASFRVSVLVLAVVVLVALVAVLVLMRGELGTRDPGARFAQMFSHSRAVNTLAAARIFLFASRDVWFVVGLPVFLREQLGWSFWQAGVFLAAWVIGYGGVQAAAPRLLSGQRDGRSATLLALALAVGPAGIALALATDVDPRVVVVVGLSAFAVLFALNSALHSYLILSYAENGKVAMSVGFYYMANAAGRLAGTILSGALYQWRGLEACLWASVTFVAVAALISLLLPSGQPRVRTLAHAPGRS